MTEVKNSSFKTVTFIWGESYCQKMFLTKDISVKTETTQLHRHLDKVLLLLLFDEVSFHVHVLGTEISPVFLEK